MHTFVLEISPLAAILCGCAALCVILIIFIYFRPLWRVRNSVYRQPTGEADGVCPASVVIFASDDSESLRRLLPSVLGQKYSGPFEVIVVNEGQSDTTAEIVERLKLIHDNLYLTYTPDGARQLSRKKLALMIGIKAARYPVVVLTNANAVIESDEWLARMTEPFTDPGVEVVLGHSYIDGSSDRKPGAVSRVFNGTADEIVWLNSALSGRPYRGTSYNLAYTRDVFFNNRGFSRSLNLKYGDDDIFISEISNRRNTRVVLHPDSFVKAKGYNVKRLYNEIRSRYYFTGRHLSHYGRRLQALGSWLLWITLILLGVAAYDLWPNLMGISVSVFCFVALMTAGIVLWRKVIFALTGWKLLFSLPLLMLMRPFANIVAYARSLSHRKYNYTWK